MKEKREVCGNMHLFSEGRKIRLRICVRPFIKDGELKGTYGIMVHKMHSVVQASLELARPLVESFPEGAFLMITTAERVIFKQESEKFDIPGIKEGTPLGQEDVPGETIRTGRATTRDLDAGVYGVPTRIMSIPLFDPDDGKLVATFNLIVPRVVADNLKQLASRLNENIQEIGAAMEEIAASADEVSANEGRLAEKVREVAENSDAIEEILDFIRGVADQTKILGINAAIEAARAGEHGRGFGVVADEIRKLSDQSKETVERIRKLIKEIEDRMGQIGRASEDTLKQGQEQAAAIEEVTAAITEIAQMTERLHNTADLL